MSTTIYSQPEIQQSKISEKFTKNFVQQSKIPENELPEEEYFSD
jgi:hypothetical protein